MQGKPTRSNQRHEIKRESEEDEGHPKPRWTERFKRGQIGSFEPDHPRRNERDQERVPPIRREGLGVEHLRPPEVPEDHHKDDPKNTKEHPRLAWAQCDNARLVRGSGTNRPGLGVQGAHISFNRRSLNRDPLGVGKPSMLMQTSSPMIGVRRNSRRQFDRLGKKSLNSVGNAVFDPKRLFLPASMSLLPTYRDTKFVGGAPKTSFPKFRSSRNPKPYVIRKPLRTMASGVA